jgi:hypothetical protein
MVASAARLVERAVSPVPRLLPLLRNVRRRARATNGGHRDGAEGRASHEASTQQAGSKIEYALSAAASRMKDVA